MTEKVFVFLAPGFEDTEAIGTIDVLRRGGLNVQTVSVTGTREVESAHGVKVIADSTIEQLNEEEKPLALVLPGGLPGADNLHACGKLLAMLRKQKEADRLIAAICASPGVVLGQEGLLEGHKATCYPSFEKFFKGNVEYLPEPIIRDRNIITAQGPAFAYDFGLAILAHLKGEAVAQEVAAGMLIKQLHY